jgi:hypothetical protein
MNCLLRGSGEAGAKPARRRGAHHRVDRCSRAGVGGSRVPPSDRLCGSSAAHSGTPLHRAGPGSSGSALVPA